MRVLEHPAARRFAFRELPGGGARFRVRQAPTPIGCVVTLVFVVFSWAWTTGCLKLWEESRNRSVDKNALGVILLIAPVILFMGWLGPVKMLFPAWIRVAGGRVEVRGILRRKRADCADVAAVERFVFQSTHRKDEPFETTSVHYAVRIKLRNGKTIEFGHGQEPEDLDWLAAKLATLVGAPPPVPLPPFKG